jgi:hypothetical protein
MFKFKMTPDRYKAIQNLNYYLRPDPPLFSLPSTFNEDWQYKDRCTTGVFTNSGGGGGGGGGVINHIVQARLGPEKVPISYPLESSDNRRATNTGPSQLFVFSKESSNQNFFINLLIK